MLELRAVGAEVIVRLLGWILLAIGLLGVFAWAIASGPVQP